MSSMNYEENGYRYGLGLAIISHLLSVSQLMRNGCRAYSDQLTPAYLKKCQYYGIPLDYKFHTYMVAKGRANRFYY